MVKLVHINKVGPSGDLYVVREAHMPVDPGYGGGLPANPAFPDNSLPDHPPPAVPPDKLVVLVKTPDGKWHYATVPVGQPPTTLPEPPPTATPKG